MRTTVHDLLVILPNNNDLCGRSASGFGFLRFALLLILTVAMTGAISGCGSIAASFANNLSTAILDQDDPELVREGVPTLLLLLDSFVQSSPNDPGTLGAAAELYAAYGTAFTEDSERAMILTARARSYGERALCASDKDACGLGNLPFTDYTAAIEKTKRRSADALYSYCIGSLAYIRVNSSDWIALAELPKVEFALEYLLQLEPGDNAGAINMYLGILNSLRPPALGGHPERGRQYFETALGLTNREDLSVQVEFARGYARLIYDRELHDALLNEVLAAEVKRPGLTLTNSIAFRQAGELLVTAEDYF
jgi:hypothetical protein